MQKKQWFALGLVFVLGVSASALVRPVQDAMMDAWMSYANPGEQHKTLDFKVGTWNMKVKMYMAPDAPPSESEATSKMDWILEGRYLKDETKGDAGGMPFEGHGLTGYDNMKKKYVTTWIDNMSTGIMSAEGTYDAAKKTYTFYGEAPDFNANAYGKTRTVEKVIDNDHFVMQAFSIGADGKETLSMEIEYARAK